jgi:hypothetical protein
MELLMTLLIDALTKLQNLVSASTEPSLLKKMLLMLLLALLPFP